MSLQINVADQVEQIRNVLHKHGTKLDIHEKQISLHDKQIELLDDHRENANVSIVVIRNKQDDHDTIIKELSDMMGKFIKSSDRLINLGTGGFVVLCAILTLLGFAVKIYFDHAQIIMK